ncbi:glycosyltransferase family 4 protein [Salinispira pacifica]
MRIALVIYGSIEQKSGGYLYDRRIAEYLELTGHQIDIVSIPWQPPRLAAGFRSAARRIPWSNLTAHCDWLVIDELVHPSLYAVGPVISALRARKALLVHHLAVSEELSPALRRLHRRTELAAVELSDLVIANSGATADSVRRLAASGSRRLPEIAVCRPGTDPPAPGAAGRKDPVIRLLSTGNLIPRKGQLLLLEVLERLKTGAGPTRPATDGRSRDPADVREAEAAPASPAVRLSLAGSTSADPRYAARVRRRAARLHPETTVEIAGYLEERELVAAYRNADLFLSASQHEGYGISLAEALRFGLPFVAFDTPVLREVAPSALRIKNESDLAMPELHSAELATSGLLVPYPRTNLFAGAVAAVASAPRLRRSMARQAAADAASLATWADTGSCFEQILLRAGR